MKINRMLQQILGTQWLINRAALDDLLETLNASHQSPEAVAKELGSWLEESIAVENRDGVAVIHVNGPIFQFASWYRSMMGYSSYDRLAQDFHTSLRSDDISAIAFKYSSPGGVVHGCSEFADMIYNARGIKPIVAYVGGDATSAAYWLASSADEIVCADTAMLGSIGAVQRIVDYSKADKKFGIEEYVIASDQSPKKVVDPSTKEGLAQVKQWVNKTADVFIGKVSRNRDVTAEKVLADFGQGDLLIGQDAVDAGLADRVGTFEQVIEELQNKVSHSSTTGGLHSQTPKKQQEILTMGQSNEEQPVGNQQPEPLTAESLRNQHPVISSEIEAAANKSERERIQGILSLDEAKGREAQAQVLAFTDGMTADQAKQILASAPIANTEASSAGFEEQMEAMGNPDVSGDAGGDNNLDEVETAAQSILAAGKALGIQ